MASEKKSGWIHFEGIKVPKKCTEKSYYVIFSKPPEIATKEGWIPKSKTREIVEVDTMIEGDIMRWILEKNYDYPSGKKEFESAQVEVIQPASEEKHIEEKKEYERFIGDTPLVEAIKEVSAEIRHLIKVLIERAPMWGRGI